jgi:hypothetical protein
MAVAIVGTPTRIANGGTYAAEAGSNRLVAFLTYAEGTNASSVTLTGVSYDSGGTPVAATLGVFDRTVGSSYVSQSVYYVKEAQIVGGTPAITATWSGTPSGVGGGIICVTLSGVDQTSPIDSVGNDHGNGITTLTATCATTSANGLMLAGSVFSGHLVTDMAWSTVAEILDASDTTSRYGLASAAATGSSMSTTPTFTSTSATVVVAAFKAAGGASVAPLMHYIRARDRE